MCRVVFVLLLAAVAMPATAAALRGADCNENGIPDDVDVSPAIRFPDVASFPLGPAPAALNSAATAPSGHETPLDLDNDGDLDIAVAHYLLEGQSSVLFNDGLGGFERSFTVRTGSYPRDLAAADLNGDGFLDLAVADSSFSGGSSGISILLNGGDGTFRVASNLSQGVRPSSVAAADIDADGDADLALATLDELVSVWKNEGDGTFRRRLQVDVGRGTHAIVAADLDADGAPDLATGDAWDERVSVLLNEGGARFASARSYPARLPVWLEVGDLDGDAFLDLVTVGSLSRDEFRGFLSPLWNAGGGAFEAARMLEVTGGPQGAAIVDLDSDGRLDLAASGYQSGSVMLFRNAGSRAFVRGDDIAVGGSLWSIAAGDADGDGDGDLAVALRDPASIILLRNASTPAASSDNDHDGVPDECEGPLFRRGDANTDGQLDISDAIAILLHLFAGGAAPPCKKSADADDGGAVDATDAIFVLRALFLRGALPAEPFRSCGGDPTPDGLTCGRFPMCP